MRTNIDIDEALMTRVMQVTGLPSKRAAVVKALEFLLQVHDQRELLEMAGKVHWDGDLAAWREGRRFDDSESDN